MKDVKPSTSPATGFSTLTSVQLEPLMSVKFDVVTIKQKDGTVKKFFRAPLPADNNELSRQHGAFVAAGLKVDIHAKEGPNKDYPQDLQFFQIPLTQDVIASLLAAKKTYLKGLSWEDTSVLFDEGKSYDLKFGREPGKKREIVAGVLKDIGVKPNLFPDGSLRVCGAEAKNLTTILEGEKPTANPAAKASKGKFFQKPGFQV